MQNPGYKNGGYPRVNYGWVMWGPEKDPLSDDIITPSHLNVQCDDWTGRESRGYETFPASSFICKYLLFALGQKCRN